MISFPDKNPFNQLKDNKYHDEWSDLLTSQK